MWAAVGPSPLTQTRVLPQTHDGALQVQAPVISGRTIDSSSQHHCERDCRFLRGEVWETLLCWYEDCTKSDRQNKPEHVSMPGNVLHVGKKQKVICNGLITLETTCTQLAGEKGT